MRYWNTGCSFQESDSEVEPSEITSTKFVDDSILSFSWKPSESSYAIATKMELLTEEPFKAVNLTPIQFSNTGKLAFAEQDVIVFDLFQEDRLEGLNESKEPLDVSDYPPEKAHEDISELMIRRA